MLNIHKLNEWKRLSTNKFCEEHLRSRSFILDLRYQQYCNVIVKMSDVKCGLIQNTCFKKRSNIAIAPIPWVTINLHEK